MTYIGTDIVPLLRIKTMIEQKNKMFLNKIFTDLEQEYCDSKNLPYIHYSGKFAAKESVKKALLSSNSINNISLKCIEISNNSNGVPLVKLKNLKIIFKELKVSISHAGNYATAMAFMKI